MDIKDFFTEEERLSIRNCILEAEKQTSGEIRVHLASTGSDNVLEAAVKQFEKLKMHETALRNGVLIFISPSDKQMAIIGDKGINEKVPDDFWDSVYQVMKHKFANSEYYEGLKQAITMSGEKLSRYFPVHSNDKDELNNEISYGE